MYQTATALPRLWSTASKGSYSDLSLSGDFTCIRSGGREQLRRRLPKLVARKAMPHPKELIDQRLGVLAPEASRPAPRRDRGEVAVQMRPAELAPLDRHDPVGAKAIRVDDPGEGDAEQRGHDVSRSTG